MPRSRNPIPTYRLHKPSGQAVVSLRGPDGRRRDVYLGGYDSPQSKVEYERILAEVRSGTSGIATVTAGASFDLTVNELLVAYLRHAEGYYVHPDGTSTGELHALKDAVRPVKNLYGHTLAREFGPLALKAVRQWMIDQDYARTLVNSRTNRVRRVFKWAASEELIPYATFQALTTVQGLRKGRSPARESDPVRPVEGCVVDLTLPYLNRQLRAMVQVQRLTGMRPGEVVRLTWGEINRSGAVWVYRPAAHKTQYQGRVRSIFIGPQAQVVLEKFAKDDPTAFLFSPIEAREERFAAMRAKRRTRVQPTQVCRRRKVVKRRPSVRYTTDSYGHGVADSIVRANKDRTGANLPPIPNWHTNQLRHTYATEVRKRYGLEAAGASLGHAKMSVTEVYAERDEALAARVAGEIG